jgi:hypothetical protein
MSDTMVLVFFQVFRGEVRIIHEYYNSGESLAFYVNYMNAVRDEHGFQLEWLVGPHDLAVTELTSGKSRRQRLYELGCSKIKVLPRYSIVDGIERVRKLIPNLYVDSSCTYLDGCLLNYSKEYDEIHQVWKAKPLHDKWSHGADVLRYIALAGFEDVPYYWGSSEVTNASRQREDFGAEDSELNDTGFAI